MEPERKSRYELWLEEEARNIRHERPAEESGPQTKRCSKCKEVKALGEYHKSKKERLGVVSRCKECTSKPLRKSRKDRFWEYYYDRIVKLEDGCYLWTGEKNKGFPTTSWEGKRTTIRRVVYMLSVGTISDDQLVLTTCNRKDCVRKSHLKLGTKEDVDMLMYNRSNDYLARRPPEQSTGFCAHRGERNNRAVITDAIALDIFNALEAGEKRSDIAHRLNINVCVVHHIASGNAWKHITGGVRHRKCLTEEIVRVVRSAHAQGMNKAEIARSLEITIDQVRSTLRPSAWKHVQ